MRRHLRLQQGKGLRPAGLAQVLEKCLARDPNDRYPTAAAMRQALKPFYTK